MDGLSAAASALAVVELAAKTALTLAKYIDGVKHAPEEISHLRAEIESGQRVIEGLRSLLLADNDLTRKSPAGGDGLDPILERYAAELEQLLQKVDAAAGTSGGRLGRFRRKHLVWPIKKSEYEGIMTRLARGKLDIMLALQARESHRNDLWHCEQSDPRNLKCSPGAAYDSEAEGRHHPCLPGTREEVLRQVRDWIEGPRTTIIYWMSGAAGTGKSTIARTVARECEASETLAATFFFKRDSADCNGAKLFFPTLAAQMARRRTRWMDALRRCIPMDDHIADEQLKLQIEKLIFDPMEKASQLVVDRSSLVFVIDALDECLDEDHVKLILNLLPRLSSLPTVDVRILVTSRPYIHINLGFTAMGHGAHQSFKLHNVAEAVVKGDIKIYLDHEFAELRKERRGIRTMELPETWPSDEEKAHLLNMATPLFIFAATVCKFIGSVRQDPRESLAKILKNDELVPDKIGEDDIRRLAPIYVTVLNQLTADHHPPDILDKFRRIVGSIILLAEPLSVSSMGKLLGMEISGIHSILNQLHSILLVPDDDCQPVRALHASLHDFLVSSPGFFRIDPEVVHGDLADCCLDTLLRPGALKTNICQLRTNTLRSEVSKDVLYRSIPASVQYACQYWVFHTTRTASEFAAGGKVYVFLSKHFFHWLEVLGLLGRVSESARAMNELIRSISETVSHGDSVTILHEFCYQGKRFLLAFRDVIDEAPLQLYICFAAFAPTPNSLDVVTQPTDPRVTVLPTKSPKLWPSEMQTLVGGNRSANTITYGPNDRLASGSDDGRIILWDTVTGAILRLLEGHTDGVSSMRFSARGDLLASGGYDRTIRMWDTFLGTQTWTITGLKYESRALRFSPIKDSLLASADDGLTIRLWDTLTAEGRGSIWTDCRLGIADIQFTPSGLLASASDEGLVQFWHVETLECVRTLDFSPRTATHLTLQPNSDSIYSIHPGNIRIVEGHETGVPESSNIPCWSKFEDMYVGIAGTIAATDVEGFIHVWQPNCRSTGSWSILRGSASAVLNSPGVADLGACDFSPDGSCLALRDLDNCVRIWNIEDTEVLYHDRLTLLKAHEICSKELYRGSSEYMQFSPTGRRLASLGSLNDVIIWDSYSGNVLSRLSAANTCPRATIQLVAFSCEDNLLATADSDLHIELWSIGTAEVRWRMKCPFDDGHVTSLVISPDEKIIWIGIYYTKGTVRSPRGCCGLGSISLADGNFELVATDYDVISSVGCSSDSETVAVCFERQIIKLFTSWSSGIWQCWNSVDAVAVDVVFSPTDPGILAYRTRENELCIYSIVKETILAKTKAYLPDDDTLRMDHLHGYRFTDNGESVNTGQAQLPLYGTKGAKNYDEIYVVDGWVCMAGLKRLLLPPSYRKMVGCVHGNILAMNNKTERVHFLRLDGDLIRQIDSVVQ